MAPGCVQELELRFVYASKPMIGSWLEDLSGESSSSSSTCSS
jgi:hypothetical protein